MRTVEISRICNRVRSAVISVVGHSTFMHIYTQRRSTVHVYKPYREKMNKSDLLFVGI